MTVNQVQQREQENPNDIDEVPVEADELDGRVVLRRKTAAQGLLEEPEQQSGAYNHVQRVEAGHTEVERKEKLRVGIGGNVGAGLEIECQAGDMVFNEFFVVFDAFDAQKNAA